VGENLGALLMATRTPLDRAGFEPRRVVGFVPEIENGGPAWKIQINHRMT
jgi:hypothetical protein